MDIFTELVPGESFTVSATLYTAYLECPQRALGRLQGIYGKSTVDSFRGSLAHKIFAVHLDEGEIADDKFKDVCQAVVGTHLKPSWNELGLDITEFRAVTRQVQDLYDRFKTLPFDGLREAEMPFEFDAGGGITVRGSMDAVFDSEEGVRIIDWKTGTYLTDREPQLAFYAMVWTLLNDEIPAAAEARSVATGETVHIEPTEDSVRATLADVGSMIEALRSAMATETDLERRAGPYCQWCPLLDDCSEGRSAVALL